MPTARLTASVREVLGRLAGIGAAAGGRRLAAHLLARALRHVLPFVRRVVLRRLARARMARRAAVVLARLGDAVALLLRRRRGVLRVGVLGGGEREDGGDGGLKQLVRCRHFLKLLLRAGPRILPP